MDLLQCNTRVSKVCSKQHKSVPMTRIANDASLHLSPAFSDVSTCAIQYSVHNQPRLGTPGHGSAVQKTQDTFTSALGYSIRHTDYHWYISGHRHQLNDISHSQCCCFFYKPLPHLVLVHALHHLKRYMYALCYTNSCYTLCVSSYMHCITVNGICTPCATKNLAICNNWIIKAGSCPSWTIS
jgi:hypothetical protein